MHWNTTDALVSILPDRYKYFNVSEITFYINSLCSQKELLAFSKRYNGDDIRNFSEDTHINMVEVTFSFKKRKLIIV